MGWRWCCAATAVVAATGCLGRTQVPPLRGRSIPTPRAAVAVVSTTRTADGLVLSTSRGTLRVSTPVADAFRLRLAESSDVQALPSFAVDASALAAARAPRIEESATMVLVRSEDSMLRIDKDPLRIALMDAAGNVIVEDTARATFAGDGFTFEQSLGPGERVFGLGDKARGFDRRGQDFELWNTDAFGWKVDQDPLYKSIPFLLFLGGARSHGLFIDHPARAVLDVGKAHPERLSYAAKVGDSCDVYVFGARDPKRIIEAYTALTGRTPLPPLWALGHHQSRYGYLSEGEVRGVVARMQKEQVPLDGIWLDIDFQDGNAPFTVSPKAFPTFATMVQDFARAGVATVVITDMHIKSYQGKPSPGYAPYDTGARDDHFIRAASGFFEGPVWPGPSVFPEFTLARTRQWWGELYADFVRQGVAGFWNDMNEPAVFVDEKTMPESVRHRLDGGGSASHTLVHNAYGLLNARATYEGLRRLRPDERPFVLTRAAYAGAQKYAASWTGDNTADRAHLAVTIPQLLNLGVSGYAFNGADVGGFVGCPDAELFADWMELGALQPFFRNHSKNDACRREPWLFGAKALARARKAVERRYRLLPYLYTVFEESSRSGAPVMRPLWFEYPDDRAVYDVANAYLLGRDLLVAPKLRAGNERQNVTLPTGQWYDAHTLELLEGGPHQISVTPDDSVRLFVRAGAILPEGPVAQSTHTPPQGALDVHVWPGPDCRGALYVDDGHSFAYQQGAFRRLSFACEPGHGQLDISSASSGGFAPWWHELRLQLHDLPRARFKVMDDAQRELPHRYDAVTKSLTVVLPGPSSDFRIRVTWLIEGK